MTITRKISGKVVAIELTAWELYQARQEYNKEVSEADLDLLMEDYCDETGAAVYANDFEDDCGADMQWAKHHHELVAAEYMERRLNNPDWQQIMRDAIREVKEREHGN